EPDAAGELEPLASRLGLERAVHVLGHVAELERRIQTARDDRVLVELALVKLAKFADLVPIAAALDQLGVAATASAPAKPTAPRAPEPPAPRVPAAPPEPRTISAPRAPA